MNTGMTSVAHLGDMTAIYPFVGYEWVFAVITAAFTIYFVVSQIAMEKGDIEQELAEPGVEVGILPGE